MWHIYTPTPGRSTIMWRRLNAKIDFQISDYINQKYYTLYLQYTGVKVPLNKTETRECSFSELSPWTHFFPKIRVFFQQHFHHHHHHRQLTVHLLRASLTSCREPPGDAASPIRYYSAPKWNNCTNTHPHSWNKVQKLLMMSWSFTQIRNNKSNLGTNHKKSIYNQARYYSKNQTSSF